MPKSVYKNVFDSTIVDFKKYIFDNKTSMYKKDYENSEDFEKLREDGKRRTALYNYMIDVINRRRGIGVPLEIETIKTVWGDTTTEWTSGTNEELKRIVEENPGLDIIFNIPLYLASTEGTRRSTRGQIEENKKREDERKRLEDEQRQKLMKQQAFEQKEKDDRLERTKKGEEKAKLKRDAATAKMLETRAKNKKAKEAKAKERQEKETDEQYRGKRQRNIQDKKQQEAKKKLEELDKIGKKKVEELRTNIRKSQEKEETDDEDEEDLEEVPMDPTAPFIPVVTPMGTSVEAMLMDRQNLNTLPKTVKEMKKAKRILAGKQKDLEEKKKDLEEKKQALQKETEKKREEKLKEYKKKEISTLKYNELSPEQKNNKIVEVTDKLKYQLEAEGYSLDFINSYYSGTLDEKQRKEINETITELMRDEDMGMTAAQYKSVTTQAIKRSKAVADNLAGATGLERKYDQTAPEYIDAVTSTANNLTEGVSASMSAAEQKAQLESNYRTILGEAEQKSQDSSMVVLIYDLMNSYGVADTIRDLSGLILPSLALTASGYKQTVKKKLGEGLSNPIYVSQNLMQRGYNNLAKFFGNEPDDDKKHSEPERKEEAESYDSQGIRRTDESDVLDFREEPSIPRFTQEESLKAKADLRNIGVGAGVLGLGVQAIRGEEPIITTKPVSSVIDKKIDNRPINITREKANPRQIGRRSEGGRRKYSPQIIYPDDEILEPTEKQLSRNEYNLAKFDFINPDNVGGNNSDGDNPLYKANDTELAIRYFDWKNMVVEKENEFVKQLPPKVSDRIKKQFRRSFVEPAEPRQTRLNYMIHDETQFAPFNSPYSEMTENTGTNPFIQTSVLYGSVP